MDVNLDYAGCAVEVATDQHGNVLWQERYPFKRANGVGESFHRDGLGYIVIAKRVTHGLLSTLVEHVVVSTRLNAREIEAERRKFVDALAKRRVQP